MDATHTPPPPRGRFGLGTLVAVLVVGLAAGGGGAFWAVRHGHAHDDAGGIAAAGQKYVCPMHPNIVSDHPGDCPICGMKLVPVGASGSEAKGSAHAAAHDTYTCPMHPTVVSDIPGDCPICGMKLVKVAAGGDAHAAPGGPSVEGLATVSIDPQRQQLIGLRTARAERGPVAAAWRTVGKVAVDETRVHHVSIKVSGFAEEVFVDYVGKVVRRGEPLFTIYSPDLLSVQQEYLLALRTRASLTGGGAGSSGDDLVEAARRRLELWDVPKAEIERLERTGKPSRTLTFRAPMTGVVTKKDLVMGHRVNAGDTSYEITDLSSVWVLADAYESDLARLKLGMTASLKLQAFPDRAFKGKVIFVDPILDPKTRTAKVRLEFPNPGGELRPEMFGEVTMQGQARQGLRVPADALIDSGTSKVVFVAVGEGKFQPREVKVGTVASDFVEVQDGLHEGEQVVTRANFLVDSESRLRASLAAMTGAAAKPAGGGHEAHGAASGSAK